MALVISEPETYGSGPSPAWLDVDWSEHVHAVSINGRRVNVLDVGEGPAIVFVHGHNVCWQHWFEQLEHFRHTHRVVAFDLPGFGESELPRDPVSISGYAATIYALCTKLGIDSA